MGDINQWQFPRNEAGKVLGWRPNGQGLENKDPGQAAGLPSGTAQTFLRRNSANSEYEPKTDAEVHDYIVAVPGLLRNRNLDQVLFTDFFTSASKLNDYRSGAGPDITQELNDMDDALAAGGLAHIPRKPGTITGTVNKQKNTAWIADGSSITDTWTCAYNGTIINIIGDGAGADGAISGVRLVGNRVTYPASIAINCQDVFTHRFGHLRIGGFNYGIKTLDCLALNMHDVYIFDCNADGALIEGTTFADSTDHRFLDCQFTGDNAGLHVLRGVTPKITASRPQSSGISNLLLNTVFDAQMIGGYIDSGVQNVATGGGNAARLVNCQRAQFIGVSCYANGDGDAMIDIYANDAASSGMMFVGMRFLKGAGQTSVEGFQFNTPTGGGFHQDIIIDDCDFLGIDTPIGGSLSVRRGLHVGRANRFPAGFGRNEGVTEAATTNPTRSYPEVYRLPGAFGAYNFVIPSAGNYEGKEYFFRRISSTGAITIQSEAGTTVHTLPAVANSWAHIVCTTSSTTAASVVWAVLASG